MCTSHASTTTSNLYFCSANRTRNPKPLISPKRPEKRTHHIFQITIGHMALLNMHEKPARRGHNKVNCRVQSILLCFHPAPSTHHGSSKTSMMAYWLRYMKYLQPETQLLIFLLPCYPCILSWAPIIFNNISIHPIYKWQYYFVSKPITFAALKIHHSQVFQKHTNPDITAALWNSLTSSTSNNKVNNPTNWY